MRLLVLLALTLAAPALAAFTPVTPRTPITLPRDHGAHPDFRTEWWYVTGWLTTADQQKLGFQLTFFRSKLDTNPANPSKFAPRQVIFAHAAISDPATGHLRHAQRVARQGFGLAETSPADTRIVLDDWTLQRRADGTFTAHVAGDDFALDLILTPTQAAILQGDAGYSQKGPNPAEASHYYSLPHLRVSGSVSRNGTPATVTGTAWLDREWSSTLLNPRAVGWDWLGLNMDDGGALTVFRVRDKAGKPVWAGGSYRDKAGRQTKLAPTDVRFVAGRQWKSPRTGAIYPVAPKVIVRFKGTDRTIPVTPLFDDQELDSRRGGGPVYWEGAVTVPGGRGYLEMTGYAAPLKM